MKKNVLLKVIFIIFLAVLIFFIKPKSSFAESQKINNLNFDVLVRNNGDLDIKETWNIEISDTNTLFKTFKMDDSYDEIKDVTVTEILTDGKKVVYEPKEEYSYHVDRNYYQALVNPDNDFEIAWGVDVSGTETRTFEINYTVANHVTLYNDCAEVYWKLIGEDFDIPIEKIDGIIKVPYGIVDEEDFRVWAHGPLNGNINKDTQYQASFSVENLERNTFLEIRIATPTSMFINTQKKVDENKLDTIISEETDYANEANEKREKNEKMQELVSNIVVIVGIIGSVLCIKYWFTISKESKENPKILPEEKIKYFRELPDENASVLEASFLYYLNNTDYNIGKIISATMLNMCLKGWISFEEKQSDNKKESIEITKKNFIIKLNKNGKELNEDEKYLYNYLKNISNNNIFTIKDFEKYNKKHTKQVQELVKEYSKLAKKENTQKETYDENIIKKSAKYTVPCVILMFCIIIAFGMIFASSIVAISVIFLVLSIAVFTKLMCYISRFNGLTQKGANQREKWSALKRYMEDFSKLDDKEVPDLVLWEKFLVFATAFGISEKVIEQLKVKFPELGDEQYLRNNYSYMYIAFNSNSNFNFINTMNSSIGSSINYSSGTGAGGGFSTGGGFGGGGRRWWRPLK